jgi:hypothetical protein
LILENSPSSYSNDYNNHQALELLVEQIH